MVLAPPCGHEENSPTFPRKLLWVPGCRNGELIAAQWPRVGVGRGEALTAWAWARAAWHPKWVAMTAMKNSRMVKMVSTAR